MVTSASQVVNVVAVSALNANRAVAATDGDVDGLLVTLVQLQEYEEAVPLYYEALKINPKFEEGMFNVAFSLFQLSDYDAAEKWINRTSGNPEKKQVFQDRIDNARRGE